MTVSDGQMELLMVECSTGAEIGEIQQETAGVDERSSVVRKSGKEGWTVKTRGGDERSLSAQWQKFGRREQPFAAGTGAASEFLAISTGPVGCGAYHHVTPRARLTSAIVWDVPQTSYKKNE